MSYTAHIIGPSNNIVESNFSRLEDGRYSVKFRPLQAGAHKIQIFKAANKEPVSEFEAEIGEENVGDTANFTINIEEEAAQNFTASVTSPTGNDVKCTVEQVDDNCSVRFLPKELGDHVIRIYDESGKPVSEFIYPVTDLNCEVGTATGRRPADDGNRLRVGEKAKVIIDPNTGATRKYRASIVATATNQAVECDFEELDDERCKVRFVPTTLGDHVIKIYKLDSNKLVYEFTFTAEDKHVGQTTTFTITIQEYRPSIRATITSPSGAQVDCSVEETGEENWLIAFTPREIGDHVVKLYQDDNLEPTTQFVYRIVERKATLPPGRYVFRVGEPIRLRFNVDGRQVSANSEFSAKVFNPNNVLIKCLFEELDDGTCKVKFTPNTIGKYTIKLFKKGQDGPISEFTFDAKDEHLDETASFTITIQAKKLKFEATVTSPSGTLVEHTIEETAEGVCIVRFTPRECGNYTIRIYEDGDSLPVTTIIYKVVDQKYDMSRKPPKENIFRVGEPIRMMINVAEEKEKLHATVTSPTNALIDCFIEDLPDGNSVVRFTPKEQGDYIIRVFQGNNPIPMSQFIYTVDHKQQQQQQQKQPQQTAPANFTLNVAEAATRKYSATVTSPSGEDLHCRVEETDDGSCRVRFIPKELGDYVVRLFQNDMQICQFNYKVDEAVKRELTNNVAYGSNVKDNIDGNYVYIQDQVFKLGEKVSFYLNLDEQKNKQFSACVTSPRHQLLPCDIEERANDEFIIRFVPKEFGDHVIKIYNGSGNAPVYQFIYKVRGFLGEGVEFKVTSFSPEPGRLAYKIMCPPKSKINYENNRDGGLYEINVHRAQPPASPTPGLGAKNCKAEGVGLRSARLGEIAEFEVNTLNAGRGSLMVGVEGPAQPAKEIVVKHIGDSVYSVNYVLDMVGNYSLYVMWGGEHIPGSPFHVTV